MAKTVKKLFADAGIENDKLLADIEGIIETIESDRSGVSFSRFNSTLNERDELRADVAELEVKVEGLEKAKTELNTKLEEAKDYKTELDEFKLEQFKKQKDVWLEKSKLFNVKEDDKAFDKIEKIKGDFKFKDDDEYSTEEIAHNLAMLKPYEKINYFGSEFTPPEVDEKRGEGEKKEFNDDPLSAFGDG